MMAQPGGGGNYGCSWCGTGGNFNTMPFYGTTGYYSMPTFWGGMNYGYPWYGPYGSMAYSNFYYPGVWGYNGINQSYYPGPSPQGGGGGCYAAKPNLYVTGTKGSEFKIEIDLKNQDSNWLAAVPSFVNKTWTGKIADNGKMKSGDANYNYFFYDFRTAENDLQDKKGFCTTRDKLIPRMATVLKNEGFKENEIGDFVQHWSMKIPQMQKFCVYPQTDTELSKVAEVKITPAPKFYKRVLFTVVPEEYFDKLGAKFSYAPTQEYDMTKSRVDRMPASVNGVEVREWGVGFLASKK
jgi:hypothetical protein